MREQTMKLRKSHTPMENVPSVETMIMWQTNARKRINFVQSINMGIYTKRNKKQNQVGETG